MNPNLTVLAKRCWGSRQGYQNPDNAYHESTGKGRRVSRALFCATLV